MGLVLQAKIFIRGHIIAETGLHIGGSKSSLDIGGVDLNVVKTPHGVPFIPGSSLKGKLRSLLARVAGTLAVTHAEVKDTGEKSDEKDALHICEIFGLPGDVTTDTQQVTRLLVRDADLDTTHFKENFEDLGAEMDFAYSDVKWENRINRKTGTAKDPRQLERVPAGAHFKFELVYDMYDDGKADEHLAHLRMAMRLLEGDYLGGQGSRGYGRVRFKDVFFTQKKIADYEGDNTEQPYDFQF